MRAVVCLKAIWDPRLIYYDLHSKQVEDLQLTLNHYDTIALAAALLARERGEVTEVVAVSAGPARAKDVLRRACIAGVDQAVHLLDTGGDGRSQVAAAAGFLHSFTPGIIFCGARGEDAGRELFGAALARELGVPYLTRIVSFSVEEGWLKGIRKLERGWREHCQVALPAVITVEDGAGVLPYVPVMGRRYRGGLRKDIEVVSATSGELGDYVPLDQERQWSFPRPRTKVTQNFSAENLWDQILGKGLPGNKGEGEKVVPFSQEAVGRCLRELGILKEAGGAREG